VERVEVTYLDTHVVVWLYDGEVGKLSRAAADKLQSDDLVISPIVLLELQYLHEIRRVRPAVSTIINQVSRDIGLSVNPTPFAVVVEHALNERWVRDPFDRLIVAHANANEAALITKDKQIRRHYRRAIW
jgi:PIN domain nuclease of toxin-antitoxin system